MKRIVVFALVLNAALLSVIAHQLVAIAGGGPEATENGDTNGDGARDITDAIYYLSWLFQGGAEPVAIAQEGGNDEDVAQLRAMVNNMFLDIEELRENSINEEQVLQILDDNGYVQAGDLVSALRNVPMREDFHPVAFSGNFEELENVPAAQGGDCCEQETSWLTDLIRATSDLPNAVTSGNNRGLYHHNFNGVNLGGVNFPTWEKMYSCTFRNADLRGASFRILEDCDFRGANLSGTRLGTGGTRQLGLNFEGTNLQGAILGLGPGAVRTGSSYYFSNFRDANLSGVVLRSITFRLSNMSNTNLANADLTDSVFLYTDLTGADLRGANIQDADFRGSIGLNLEGTRGTPAFMPDDPMNE